MAERPTILVVDDEESYRDALSVAFEREGFQVETAADGPEAIDRFDATHPALVLLDVMLPRMSGVDVCRELRTRSQVPIIMVTARNAEIDAVVGLEVGADDYVTKPFSPRELVARVKAILRRTTAAPAVAEVVVLGDLEVDSARREARVAGAAVALASREFDLLAYLAAHPGLALTRRQLLDGVWGAGWVGDERTVDVHVRQLRKKLGDAFVLTTVWGVGYRLEGPG